MALLPLQLSHERSSWLAFDKSTVVVWTAISLLVVETFSGMLRYAFDLVGLSMLLYVPKVACLVLFAIELLTLRARPVFWVLLLGWLASSVLGMLHGARLFNLAFSLFALSPLLLGMLCGEHLLHRRKLFGWAIALCLLASLAGLLLDKFTSVPWKGYSYSVGGTELSANTSWNADGEDRIAGFARVSNVLAILIACFTLYLFVFIRSRPIKAIIGAGAFYAIMLTTSKAPALAFALALGLMLIQHMNWTCRALCLAAVVAGMFLPTLGLMFDFDARTVSGGGSSLASLYDRLNNTWPRLYDAMLDNGWAVTGAGFGMVGSTMAIFPVAGAELLLGMDSSVMYLWGMLGLGGLLLYALQVPLLFALIADPTRQGRMLLTVGLFWCLVSWTTDMFEVAVANLFLGLVIGQVLGLKPAETPLTHPPQVPLAPLATRL